MTVHTVEGFLTAEETAQLTKVMDAYLAQTGWVPDRPSDGLVPPEDAQEILAAATERALPAIRRVFPSVAGFDPYLYHDLGPGDRIDAHLHGIGDHSPRRVARVAFHLQEPVRGGEFFIETCSSDAVWTDRTAGPDSPFAAGMRFAREIGHGQETEAAWLDAVPRSRWTSTPPPGTAVVYGAQLIHGVNPVVEGRLRKLITNLVDATR
jgi:hypothetical protein